ncbi:MAG TPA: ATP-binding protein [Thermoanaerobaculia bacterium]|nr:ATP-binding protein [Thermoanaerobaculia bacterium]
MKRYDRRVIAAGLLSIAPIVLALFALLMFEPHDRSSRVTIIVVVAVSLLIFVAAMHTQLVYPLRTLSNLISALREEDYSIRARGAKRDGAIGEVMTELNLLTDTLHERRLGEVETTALLRSVVEQIDSAIFTFDDQWRLRLVNRAGERLLGRSAEQLQARTASELGLESFLTGDETASKEVVLPGGHGRFRIRRTTFRQHGVPHFLLVMSDLSRALREEERQAWQRLLRVISHELNNSLAPIRSIAASLANILGRDPLPEGWLEDTQRGLGVIGSRAEGLTRFLQAYAQLARLPQPVLRPMSVGDTVRRVAGLETRMKVQVDGGPAVTIRADRDQLEQLLINLVRNAVDAALETGGGVSVEWTATNDAVEISVLDEGAGISGTANLFIPFFTTKPSGTGIGLTLARQIAEAHNGVLTLTPRPAPATGAVARIRLPR